jgi:hypothetical protein
VALIKCEGCTAVHESTLPVCPGCGRCPNCGERRVSKQELAERAACPSCATPYCTGCGRCHVCGALRFTDMPAHECGFPTDPEQVRTVEKVFGLQAQRGGGCLSVVTLALAPVAGAFGVLWWHLVG